MKFDLNFVARHHRLLFGVVTSFLGVGIATLGGVVDFLFYLFLVFVSLFGLKLSSKALFWYGLAIGFFIGMVVFPAVLSIHP